MSLEERALSGSKLGGPSGTGKRSVGNFEGK